MPAGGVTSFAAPLTPLAVLPPFTRHTERVVTAFSVDMDVRLLAAAAAVVILRPVEIDMRVSRFAAMAMPERVIVRLAVPRPTLITTVAMGIAAVRSPMATDRPEVAAVAVNPR